MKTFTDRFWFLVARGKPEECWPWQGALNGNGYGNHRKAYELTYGPIAPGLVIMHGCNNRSCCNPAHLIAGTQKQNLAFAKMCGRLDNRKKSLSVRKAKNGTGVQFDKRSDNYAIMFKVLGKPLYIGMSKDKALAEDLAKAAFDVVERLLTTTENPTYEQIKEHFKCV